MSGTFVFTERREYTWYGYSSRWEGRCEGCNAIYNEPTIDDMDLDEWAKEHKCP